MPANPPHADRQFGLGYVVGAHIKAGYVGSTELLTRAGAGSDFATDVCVRREGTDPKTGVRYLEELAFEVVNEQSERNSREKAIAQAMISGAPIVTRDPWIAHDQVQVIW